MALRRRSRWRALIPLIASLLAVAAMQTLLSVLGIQMPLAYVVAALLGCGLYLGIAARTRR